MSEDKPDELSLLDTQDGPAAFPKFGRYVIDRLLGRGSFGEVFVAHDPELDRAVAIKVPRTSDPDEIADFLEEARRLARLRHPGILAVHDVGVQDGRAYIVSDLLEGVSLLDWFKEPRPWPEVARVIAAIADALAHAHGQRVVHRDVKPPNIMISGEQAVLFDFGLALSERTGDEPDKRVLGSPLYMSPEQVDGEAHRIDGRTDIWSAGVMLYEGLCGRRPFHAQTKWELYRRIREDDPQPPRQLVPELPRELERICMKALSKRLSDRYTTAADMASELRAVIRKEAGAAAQPPSWSPPAATPTASSGSSSGSLALRASERAAAPEEAHRRQLTLIAARCDGAAGELDPEEQVALLGVFRQVCTDVSRRCGGTVIPAGDDGVLVCFGYPNAYEDAAQRAVRTALSILREARMQAGRAPVYLTLHSALALVGDDGTGGLSIVGEARTVATRLEHAAPADSVVVSEATHRLVAGFFVCEDLGDLAVKGLKEPVRAYRVERPSDAQTRIEVAGTGLSPLVGRDQEVGLLCDRWEQVKEGLGQVALVVGEPGIGKSRLIHALKEQVGLTDAVGSCVAEWRCSPYYTNTALYPAIDYFERKLALDEAASADERLARLVEMLAGFGLDMPDTVPLFAALLSIPTGDAYPPLAFSPQRQKERTLEVLLSWARQYALARPMLFVVEDLHWIDATSLEFLGLLTEQCLADRVLALFTFRPDFTPAWARRAHQTQVALNRLTRRQTAELIRKRAGAEVPQEWIDRLTARTDGVPLFVEEFTRMALESGFEGAASDTAIPATLSDLLMARVDRLAGTRELIQLGAALGREFSHEMLHAVAPHDEGSLQCELAKLVDADILYPKGLPSARTYVFKHALIQDAAYQSLVRSKRQHLHRTIARVLEEKFPARVEAQPEWVAHHHTEAGSLPEAVVYWERASGRAMARFAHAEAIGHLKRGLELLARLPPGPDHDRTELRFQGQLTVALATTRGWAAPELAAVHARARELCLKLHEDASLFHTMWGTWAWRLLRTELDIAKTLSDELLELARSWKDPGCEVEALWAVGCTSLFRGEFGRGAEVLARAAALHEPARSRQHAQATGQDTTGTIAVYRAWMEWFLGRPERALSLGQEAVARAKALRDPFTEAFSVYHYGATLQLARQASGVAQMADATLALAEEQSYEVWKGLGALCRGAGQLLAGKPADAARSLRAGLERYQSSGARLSSSYYLCHLAEACRQVGRLDEAWQAVERGLEFVATSRERVAEAELLRLRGELVLARTPDAHDEAEACFARALAVAQEQDARGWALRASMSLARLRHRQGRNAEATAALLPVYAGFAEGHATPDLVDARGLLDRLGA